MANEMDEIVDDIMVMVNKKICKYEDTDIIEILDNIQARCFEKSKALLLKQYGEVMPEEIN